jgi:hypothetical protein
MRLPIVARSLGIILASPLVALLGQTTSLGHASQEAAVLEAQPPQAPAPVVRTPPPTPQKAEPKPTLPATTSEVVEVSVTCESEGCVVQDGLAIIVESPRP